MDNVIRVITRDHNTLVLHLTGFLLANLGALQGSWHVRGQMVVVILKNELPAQRCAPKLGQEKIDKQSIASIYKDDTGTPHPGPKFSHIIG